MTDDYISIRAEAYRKDERWHIVLHLPKWLNDDISDELHRRSPAALINVASSMTSDPATGKEYMLTFVTPDKSVGSAE